VKVDQNIEKFAAELSASLADASFVKLVLSNYKGSEPQLQKISARTIETRKGRQLMFQFRYEARDIVKNLSIAAARDEVRRRLAAGFCGGHLFTTRHDVQLDIGKRNSRIKTSRPTFTSSPSSKHDREKHRLIDPNAYYLKALGISTEDGKIKSGQQDKWRQINKFVEILASLIDSSPLKDKPGLSIIDMGSGKGYLTFAAYDHLTKGGQKSVADHDSAIRMTGVEQRPDLVSLCTDIANAGGWDGLKFVQGSIGDVDPGPVDILIALHACDTATDDALYKGIAANASIIIAAPCCHKELRKQITPPEMLAGILKHGIMLERTAETLTDGLRALLLESRGYSTKLFEFVPTEHTPKNNMLVATKKKGGTETSTAARQIDQLRTSFGIREQRLEKLLSKGNIDFSQEYLENTSNVDHG